MVKDPCPNFKPLIFLNLKILYIIKWEKYLHQLRLLGTIQLGLCLEVYLINAMAEWQKVMIAQMKLTRFFLMSIR